MSGSSRLPCTPHFQAPHSRGRHPKVLPHTDIVDNGSDILVLVNLPGVPIDHITLELDGNELSVHGCSCCENKAQGLPLTMVALEFVDVEYCMTIDLSHELDADGIRAFLENGVLAIQVPRRPRVKRRIPIEQH